MARLSYPRALAWMVARLAEALDHARRRGVTHGDIKPSNILITADGTPMLFDFNLAVDRLDAGDPTLRADLGGTLAYMAPERLQASPTRPLRRRSRAPGAGRAARPPPRRPVRARPGPGRSVDRAGPRRPRPAVGRPPILRFEPGRAAGRPARSHPALRSRAIPPGSGRSWPAAWPPTRATATPGGRTRRGPRPLAADRPLAHAPEPARRPGPPGPLAPLPDPRRRLDGGRRPGRGG